MMSQNAITNSLKSQRILFHETLTRNFGDLANIYYEPPANIQMKYPAIIYRLENYTSEKADNIKYLKHRSYTLILITCNPDDDLVDLIYDMATNEDQDSGLLSLTYIRLNRHYVTENLHHYVFEIHF